MTMVREIVAKARSRGYILKISDSKKTIHHDYIDRKEEVTKKGGC